MTTVRGITPPPTSTIYLARTGLKESTIQNLQDKSLEDQAETDSVSSREFRPIYLSARSSGDFLGFPKSLYMVAVFPAYQLVFVVDRVSIRDVLAR